MSSILRTSGQVTGFSLMIVPLAIAGQSAFAAQPCETTTPAATIVAPGICQVAFTVAGDYTFTAPSGITKLQAVVVGGGSAAVYLDGLYGGGGGDVQFFDDVDFSAPIELTVGEGGTFQLPLGAGIYGASIEGTSSYLGTNEVRGGFGPTSGNGNFGFIPSDTFGSGGGAGGDAESSTVAGPGVTPSEIALGSLLFPALANEPELGAGGWSITEYGVTNDPTPQVPGHGGNVNYEKHIPEFIYIGDDGVDGAVYFRWASTLADTGFDATSATASAAALIAGGLLIMASRREKKLS